MADAREDRFMSTMYCAHWLSACQLLASQQHCKTPGFSLHTQLQLITHHHQPLKSYQRNMQLIPML